MFQFSGGCLCGALRYKVEGQPLYAGFCCCGDCRKASGAACMPFIGVLAAELQMTGLARQSRSVSVRGTEAVRNTCASCGSLVFGGTFGEDDSHTIYAGSLDDLAVFQPTIGLFARDRPSWCALPPGLKLFDTMPE
jgi:hypothetical protein